MTQQDEMKTAERLARIEERHGRAIADIQTLMQVVTTRLPGMEARVMALWEMYPRLAKTVESTDADAKKFFWGMFLAALGLAGQYLAFKMGL